MTPTTGHCVDHATAGLEDLADAHLRKSMLDEDLLTNVGSLLREAV